MTVHTVEQGEHLSGIAAKYGFRTINVIWEHASNAALKARRKNPHVLLPGDQIAIPDKQEKIESRGTTETHRFVLVGQKLTLRITLRDINDKPRPGVSCTLTISNESKPVVTDGAGTITTAISKSARTGTLVVQDLDLPLLIGHLDPVEEKSGQLGRLNNLGYEAGEPDSPHILFRSAVEEFQCDQKMAVTGKCDTATQARLKRVHGC